MAEPRLLSGGNPQIPKGDGNGPVQDYIAAMPGWKRNVGRRLDDLIERTVPGVHKAVKWNQPFFRGASLDPLPPKTSTRGQVRYLDIHEDDDLDEDRLVSWIEQASNLPGVKV